MKKILITFLCFLLPTTMYSQSWRANADSLIINHVFVDKIDHIDIYAFTDILSNSDTIISADNDTILVPYANCIGYFVNLMPFAHWAHHCQYCFVDAMNNYTIVDSEMPPNFDSLSVLSLCNYNDSIPIVNTTLTFDTLQNRMFQHCDCDSDHLWAVLICGDDEVTLSKDQDHYPHYWFDLSCVYTVLANVFGYHENTDETFQNRRIVVMAPQSVRTQYETCDLNGNDTYLNNNLSIQEDKGGDFFFSDDDFNYTHHKKENIKNIFDCFAGVSQHQQNYESFGLRKLDERDQLFIFVTGHGHSSGEDSYFYVNEGNNNKPTIFDNELISWLTGIQCSQMTLFMENCYSGGFIDKFIEDISNPNCLCKNRVGFSATSYEEASHAEGYQVYYESPSPVPSYHVSEFVYYWASAALGYYPYLDASNASWGPWSHPVSGRDIGSMNWSPYFHDSYEQSNPHAYYDVNPDSDQDGILSFSEMFAFANNLDTWSPQGYYHPIDPYASEDPQQQYESSFTKEAATLVGYEGQINGSINSGTVTQPYRLCGDIWVGSDSELTMWDEVQSPENVRIYIKQSGKLILDGGSFTNLPEQHSPMWQGVQVWGNKNKHQLQENGRYWQGVLDMRNGAVIRNAVIGVNVWNPDDIYSSGGIVTVTDSRFVNNGTAIFFQSYENCWEDPLHISTTRIRDNVSFFKNCEFIIDDNYLGPDESEKQVELFQVRGIQFKGCHFIYHHNYPSDVQPVGIYAYDAGFRINGYCAPGNQAYPCQMYDRSSFDSFYKAVVSVNDGSIGLRPITILNTDFLNNCFGVFAIKSGYATILNTTFHIGQDSTQCAAGIWVENTPVFTIEQDTFCLASCHPDENYGIVVKNSKSQNLIYKNMFKSLYCANLSIGRNNTWITPRNEAIAKTNILGLEYRCNENIDNRCDYYVLGGNYLNHNGIQSNQGSIDEPASNTFSIGSIYQFMNHGNYGINYYYNPTETNMTPNNNSIYAVNREAIKTNNSCLPHYQAGGWSNNDTLLPVIPSDEKLQREIDYYNAYSAYYDIQTIYDRLIDGGNTGEEIADIQSTTSSNMWAMRAQLLGHSPYLTDGVLISMLSRDEVFPQSILFEVLASNPDELKKDTILDYLRNMDNPLPDYMLNLLKQMADGITARTAMESQLANYSQKYRQAAGDIIRSILNDSIIDKEALVVWLGNMNDIESDRDIVSIYMEDGNFTDALALANMFPSLYSLTGDDMVEHNYYMTLLNLYQVLYVEGRDIMQLDSAERAIIAHIADHGSGAPQAMAKAIMMEVYGYYYDDCPNGLELDCPVKGWKYTSLSSMDEDNIGKAMGFAVNVSPNPATTWISIDYTLPMGLNMAQMKITNAMGVNVATYELSGKEGQKVLDLRNMSSGVYTYTVYCGKQIQTGKLVIVKQ